MTDSFVYAPYTDKLEAIAALYNEEASAHDLGLDALAACPFRDHHGLTLDEVAAIVPSGQATRTDSVKTRLHAARFRTVRVYEAERVIGYLRSTPGSGWRKGMKGGW